MKHRCCLIAFCVVVPFFANASFCLWMVKFAMQVLHHTSGPQPREQINLRDGRVLEFTRDLGQGKSGRIQRIARLGDYEYPLVVKYARNKKAQVSLEREYFAYGFLLEFCRGRRPKFVVPILEAPVTRGGRRVLIKPELHGTPLEKYIATGIELDPPQKKSLRDLRAWAKDAADTRVFGDSQLDLNPGNLVWVDDANDLMALGLNIDQPLFVLYEVGRAGFFDSTLYQWLFFWRLLR